MGTSEINPDCIWIAQNADYTGHVNKMMPTCCLDLMYSSHPKV